MKKTCFALLLLVHTLCFSVPRQIIIIRHAEEADTGIGLSEEGFARADVLADYFQMSPKILRYGTPDAIFATHPKEGRTSSKSIETVKPLADALGLEVITTFARNEERKLAEYILGNPQFNGKTVLICWKHRPIHKFAYYFGVRPKPKRYPRERFDINYVVYFNNSVPACSIFPQEYE